MRLLPIVAAALLATQLSTAQAALQTESFSTTLSLPSGASFLDLQQFDPSKGHLQQVSLTLTAQLTGTAKGEAMGSGGLITLVLESAITVQLPGGDPAGQLTLSPQAMGTFNATSYDKVRDYAGTSGTTMTVAGEGATDTDAYSFTDGAMLDLFKGTGTVQLNVTTAKLNRVTGPGVRFATTSENSLVADITYTYMTQPQFEPPLQLQPVPEPSTWALMFAGLGLVGWLARRRNA